MKHSRFQIVYTNCRRCNKPIATGNRSIYGADQLKAKYDRICESCITPDERHAIEQGLASAILGYDVTIPQDQTNVKAE